MRYHVSSSLCWSPAFTARLVRAFSEWALGQILPLTKLIIMRTWCVLHFFFVGNLEVSLYESLKWSFTTGWGGGEEGHGISSHLREPIGQSLDVHCQVGTVVAVEAFSQEEGGGLVSNTCLMSRMRWEHLSLPSVTVSVGKNREAQHEFMLCIWWYQIISFWSSVYFYLGWGGGCLLQGFKNASDTVFFTNDW